MTISIGSFSSKAAQPEIPLQEARSGEVRIPEPKIIDLNQRFTFDVAIVGLGYVGLPTALAFRAAGRSVLGIDASQSRLKDITRGAVDLLESDHERLRANVGRPGFELTDQPGRLAEAAAVIVCVPTPVDEYLQPELNILRRACATVVEQAVPGQTLIMTSTTYVGSTQDMLVKPLLNRRLRAGVDIFVAFSPERIDPGNDRHAHEDVARVVGGVTPECTDKAVAVLSGYAQNLHRVSSPGAAEMTKLLENTFRAVNIAMVNEFAEASRTLGLNVMEVVEAASTKPYGFMRFTPGPGVGGHCIPCDPHYLLWQLRKERLSLPVVEQAMAGIATRPLRVVGRVREELSSVGIGLTGARVLVAGVAYKPDVEDLRESPALEIIEGLHAAGAIIEYHDPLIPSLTRADGSVMNSVEPVVDRYDIVVVHTLHTSMDLGWLDEQGLVLDTTYRLQALPQRVAL